MNKLGVLEDRKLVSAALKRDFSAAESWVREKVVGIAMWCDKTGFITDAQRDFLQKTIELNPPREVVAKSVNDILNSNPKTEESAIARDLNMYKLWIGGMTKAAIATQYGLHINSIYRVANNNNWNEMRKVHKERAMQDVSTSQSDQSKTPKAPKQAITKNKITRLIKQDNICRAIDLVKYEEPVSDSYLAHCRMDRTWARNTRALIRANRMAAEQKAKKLITVQTMPMPELPAVELVAAPNAWSKIKTFFKGLVA